MGKGICQQEKLFVLLAFDSCSEVWRWSSGARIRHGGRCMRVRNRLPSKPRLPIMSLIYPQTNRWRKAGTWNRLINAVPRFVFCRFLLFERRVDLGGGAGIEWYVSGESVRCVVPGGVNGDKPWKASPVRGRVGGWRERGREWGGGVVSYIA